MGDKTGIQWTDATWNPVVGCDIVSPGCTNCYAMRMAARIERMTPDSHYAGTTRPSKAGPVWTGRIAMAPDSILTAPLRWRRPRRIFVNSMGDLFHESIPDEAIDKVFAVMALAPRHTFQVLTKRAARMRAYMADDLRADMWDYAMGIHFNAVILPSQPWPPLPNVWLGVSAEDQRRADERIPELLATPAAVRFVSAEPLLGLIDLKAVREPNRAIAYRDTLRGGWRDEPMGKLYGRGEFPAIDWIIAGGESGPGARPAHPDWFRSLRDQCAAAGVPFFLKQWGGWTSIYDRDRDDPYWLRCDAVARDSPSGRWLNLAGGHGFHGERVVRVAPLNKNLTGHELDGREHREFPR